MARICNLDRIVNPRPVSIVCNVDLERGMFVEIQGMAQNNLWLAGGDDYEAYSVIPARAGASISDVLIHTTVPMQYDERLVEADFVLKAGETGRGHYITVGDEITIAADLIDGEIEVGTELGFANDGKLAAGTGVAKVVKVYNWNGQQSVMIRFI